MADLLRIDCSEFSPPDKMPDVGTTPVLQWLEIKKLVVDPKYQRQIRGAGRNNVRKIAAGFKWSCFAPVVVSRVDADLFAIVDGQHRTTAAALLGIKKVPCQIIHASPTEQALAFKEINDATTKMSRQQIHAAAVAANDDGAMALEDIASRAGVEILRYPLATNLQVVGGQTMAIACLESCLQTFGQNTLVTALQCVTQTENNMPGLLVGQVIKALCMVMDMNRKQRDSGEKLLRAFDQIDITAQFDAARAQPKAKGTSTTAALAERLNADLKRYFEGA